jgi:hypothetical protein
VIDAGILVERLAELGELLGDALEQLEAEGRREDVAETLVRAGDKLLVCQSIASRERRLVGHLTRVVTQLIELGEEGRAS